MGWIFGFVCLGIAAVLILYYRSYTKKTFDGMEQMLSSAMEGSFFEKTFDESRLSALETKLAHYLAASAVSARQVEAEKNRLKTWISDISHQTKTPIANLSLYSELLLEENLPPTAKSNVEALHEQTEKLRFLIDALVKLSRLENGILSFHPARQPLQPVLEQIKRQLGNKAAQKGLYLQVESTESYASLDARWVTEALCNIVDNGIKYTNEGGVKLTVTPYDMFVRIDVADTGVGILEAEQPRVFARFYRSEHTGQQEGVGLGLYLAREIIAGQGGYIKLSSALGKGSVFSVFLPT